MGTYRSVIDYEVTRRWLLENGLAEQCTHCGRRWQTARPQGHMKNGPYVIVERLTGEVIGTSADLVAWETPAVQVVA